MTTYKDDGVNIPLGDALSAFAAQMTKLTYNNCPFVRIVDYSAGEFRGPVSYCLNTKDFPFLAKCSTTVGPDGVGTKSIAIAAAKALSAPGADIIAMTGTDITRDGGYPIVFTQVLDTSTLGEDESSETYQTFKEIMAGLVMAAV